MPSLNTTLHFLTIAATGLLPQIAIASPVIPKIDLVTCEVKKDDIKDWFGSYHPEEKLAFESVVDPMLIRLQQVELAGQPGDYYKVALRGVDQNGRNIQAVQRTIEQLAVNWSANAISVAYAPYDVSRTSTPPFSLLIENSGSRGSAVGHLSVVPLQSTSALPMRQLRLNCQIEQLPERGVSISRSDLATLHPAAQFELLHALKRLDMTSYVHSKETFAQLGISQETVEQMAEKISQHLSKRTLPRVEKIGGSEPLVKITEGDRCGGVKISSYTLQPIYDSQTLREWRRTKNPELRKQALGFVISRLTCEKPARQVQSAQGSGSPWMDDTWRIENVIVTSTGMIEGYSFKAAGHSLY